MTTHPKYPPSPRNTGQLLRSLIVAIIMLILITIVTQ
jgi:hypothetical protein